MVQVFSNGDPLIGQFNFKPPSGFISLKNASVQKVGGDAKKFQIVTKKHAYVLKGKHEDAANDWVQAIEKVINKVEHSLTLPKCKKSNGSSTQETIQEFDDLSLAKDGLKRILVWRTGKKTDPNSRKGSHKFPDGPSSISIGRSSACTICIDEDRKLSREHARIETKDGISFTFIDLGSSRGSKVNRIPITKLVLKDGDRIKIGSTKMEFKGNANIVM